MPEWLASGRPPRDVPGAISVGKGKPGRVIAAAGVIEVQVKETGAMRRIEMTQDAIEVALAFMDLPKRERVRFKRQIQVAALAHAEDKPDEQLGHLAAPGTPTANKTRGLKKPSRHAQ